MSLIAGTALDVCSLCLGGNVFGWTADESDSFAVLDAYVAHGGNFIDTADVYSSWADGNVGGESESIIGAWVSARSVRPDVILATKIGAQSGADPASLRAGDIVGRTERCLDRLQTDYIDLLFAHYDDLATPMEETLAAFSGLIQCGKVRYIAASNFTADRLRQAVATSDAAGLPRYCAIQTHYSLVSRNDFEADLATACADLSLSCLPYWGLEKGFLTGKYRSSAGRPDGLRAQRHTPHDLLDDRGVRILAALDAVAAEHGEPLAAVALAWLMQQPSVTSVVASARVPQQLGELMPALDLKLNGSQLELLDLASSMPTTDQRSPVS
jgi:aryl-alcohol dehydrogenase-like predicted oxidoreductase